MAKPDTVQLTVTLPAQVVRRMEELIPEGYHGASRAEVARTLILDQLKLLKAQTVTVIAPSVGGSTTDR